MKFIKPDEISGKILTLLEEANEYVVIVSPYVKISKWYKLTKKLDKLKRRKVSIEFIIRDDNTNLNSFNEVSKLGFSFRAIPDLHCKLYLNEKKAIFSSMNLLLSSEINSIEIGYETENDSEYLELKEFCSNYLKVQFDHVNKIQFEEFLFDRLSNSLNKKVKVQFEDGNIKINTSTNNYKCFIWNSKGINRLRISGILSGKEFEFLKNQSSLDIKNFEIEIQDGESRHYDMIWGTSLTHYKSNTFNSILDQEHENFGTDIINFILAIEEIKKNTI